MSDMSRLKSSMTINGYIDRIEFHFERLAVSERPSQEQYVDAWNNEVPAKKMADTFARRHASRGGGK